MTLPESYYTFEEHMHTLEEEHEKEDYCGYEEATGDKRYPVLCLKRNQYWTRDQCSACKQKRREENA